MAKVKITVSDGDYNGEYAASFEINGYIFFLVNTKEKEDADYDAKRLAIAFKSVGLEAEIEIEQDEDIL